MAVTVATRALTVGLAAAALAGCSSGGPAVRTHPGVPVQTPSVGAHGVITGMFLAVGGPAGALPSPQRGRIDVLRPDGQAAMSVKVPRNGTYSFGILPGRYTLVGHTPQFHVNGERAPCRASHPVTVRVGKIAHLDTYCQRR